MTIKSLRIHAADFSPFFATSIAYRPLPRPILDAFLMQRGLLSPPLQGRLRRQGMLHAGLLNKMYFRLNQIAFDKASSHAIHTYVGGQSVMEVDLTDIDPEPATESRHNRGQSLDTGGGTDHDDESIRERPQFTYEGVFNEPLRPPYSTDTGWRPWGNLSVWFGITPFGRTRYHSHGVAVDLKLDDTHDRYVRF